MKFKVFIWLVSLLSLTSSSDRFKRRVGAWGPKKISCIGNPKYVKDELCTLKPVSRNELLMSFGVTTLAPQTNFQLQLQHWQKMSSNRFMPGIFNVKGDVCELMDSIASGKTNVLKSVLMQLDVLLFDNYKAIIHPCPYTGAVYVHNVSVPRHYKHPLISLIPMAEFKIDIKAINQNGDEMYLLNIFFSDK